MLQEQSDHTTLHVKIFQERTVSWDDSKDEGFEKTSLCSGVSKEEEGQVRKENKGWGCRSVVEHLRGQSSVERGRKEGEEGRKGKWGRKGKKERRREGKNQQTHPCLQLPTRDSSWSSSWGWPLARAPSSGLAEPFPPWWQVHWRQPGVLNPGTLTPRQWKQPPEGRGEEALDPASPRQPAPGLEEPGTYVLFLLRD